ncbi:Uncharacterized damage-inducible protein DinB (forms a four-helix bundle) [Loktanella fryxellensis]|uniref:Uncharacterized damage-inducible protein DinB (Forms a four-helix bundle) n=1 Tax=Loktanella fryxellensis TaxID=245187 RepID=A0A1H8I106_9RHOB|nr:DinB family protein [Loktanella fryxellensis]SEN62203.1 Uncharacterized damage-inducible protein DinB (forms a four-helix bundle) [Loktanella fryxellensis]
MIDRAYCRRMARYNAWQNRSLWAVMEPLSQSVLTDDAGLPQGSVLGTLNHLLWLDRMWLSRLYKMTPPPVTELEAVDLTATPAAWWAERFRTDGALRMWADTLATVDLHGQIAFWSISRHSDVIVPRDACVIHLFTQQTDLRARVRQVLGAVGHALPPTALFLMPEE